MEIDFTKKNISDHYDEKPLKKRKWDRWLYIAILLILLFSLLKWLISPWIFNYADGFLLQNQFDVKFANDIRVLEYKVKQGQTVRKGDTICIYELYSDTDMGKTFIQDSIKSIMDGQGSIEKGIALDNEIKTKDLIIQELTQRLAFWKKERIRKEKLVYLNYITPNELANVDRSIDDVNFQLQSLKAEVKVLKGQYGGLTENDNKRILLSQERNNILKKQRVFVSPVNGKIDRLRILEGQVCYKGEIVASIVHSGYFVRAYIELSDLDDFSENDIVAIKLPYGFNNTLKGKVKKIYYVSELKDITLMNKYMNDNQYGVVVDISPEEERTWQKVKVSNIPVKVRKLKFD
ncbi:HlyD family efflux transporter periplasmic adaptor subunit [Chryseobacterium nematophagum]|uniref:HlyD family efflux transporter periplasmic adaptor subunit n=1 Tax=Chryseobacterium nematophagum TaxID=2305228 RepID=A0A3M7LC25_9FLAO|nr:HlyD family efflux transporter periplasmic adaptor subunit [Chryseobacterium nematophagum]RMZ60303.1 HlyD family efflux transporter periplasmic adaptor subunit [Chryseobacterium nematophagum]